MPAAKRISEIEAVHFGCCTEPQQKREKLTAVTLARKEKISQLRIARQQGIVSWQLLARHSGNWQAIIREATIPVSGVQQ
jgi:hypothetical protein